MDGSCEITELFFNTYDTEQRINKKALYWGGEGDLACWRGAGKSNL